MSLSSLWLENRRLLCRNSVLPAPSIKTPVRMSHRCICPPQLTSSTSDVLPFPNPSPHPAYLTVVRTPLPTVTCFIPSILPGSPFRVSLHSWSTPTVSRDTLAKSPQESTVGFEAKVLLDGVCVAYVIMPLVLLTVVSSLTDFPEVPS